MRASSITHGATAVAVALFCGIGAGSSPAAAAEATRPVHLRFEGVIGDLPFQCGRSYEGIGTARSTLSSPFLRA